MSVGVSKDADAGATRRLPSSLFAIVGHTLRTVVGLFALKAVQERLPTLFSAVSSARSTGGGRGPRRAQARTGAVGAGGDVARGPDGVPIVLVEVPADHPLHRDQR